MKTWSAHFCKWVLEKQGYHVEEPLPRYFVGPKFSDMVTETIKSNKDVLCSWNEPNPLWSMLQLKIENSKVQENLEWFNHS